MKPGAAFALTVVAFVLLSVSATLQLFVKIKYGKAPNAAYESPDTSAAQGHGPEWLVTDESCDRNYAERVLASEGEPGCFLVRMTKKTSSGYILSYLRPIALSKDEGFGITHLPIQCPKPNVFCFQGKSVQGQSLVELVTKYQQAAHDLPFDCPLTRAPRELCNREEEKSPSKCDTATPKHFSGMSVILLYPP